MNNKKWTILAIVALIIIFIINVIAFNVPVTEESTELHKIKDIEYILQICLTLSSIIEPQNHKRKQAKYLNRIFKRKTIL